MIDDDGWLMDDWWSRTMTMILFATKWKGPMEAGLTLLGPWSPHNRQVP